MNTPNLSRRGFLGIVLLAATMASVAAPTLDLERLDPVANDQPVPIRDFFRPAYFSSLQLNFAGIHVAALVSGGFDKYRMMVVDLAKNDLEVLPGIGRMDVNRFDWSTDDRLIFSLSLENQWGGALAAVNGGSWDNPYPLIQSGRHSLIGIPESDRLRRLPWVSSLGRGKDGGIVKLNTDVNSAHCVDLQRANVKSYDYSLGDDYNRKSVPASFPVPEGGIESGDLSDTDGDLAYSYTLKDGISTLQHFNGDAWSASPVDREFVDVLGVSEDRAHLNVNQDRYDGAPSPVREMDAMSGEMGRVLLEDNGYDFEGDLYRDRAPRLPVGAVFDWATPAMVWFEQTYQDLQKLFEGIFPRKIVRIVSGNQPGSVFVWAVSSDVDPMSHYVVDLDKKSLGPLKASRPWIDPKGMNRMKIIKYRTADGHKLDAYLMLPKGRIEGLAGAPRGVSSWWSGGA